MKPIRSVLSRSGDTASLEILAEEEVPATSVFSRMAFACWLGTIFILYSRFFDLALRGLYIPKLVLSLVGIFFLISGRTLVFARSTVGKIMLAFVVWVSFTLIFSVWKSGSLPFYSALLQSFLFFAIAAGLPSSISEVRKSISALAFSGLLAALMSFKWGVDREGRLALSDGSYFDPNYYAMAIAAVIPFFGAIAASAQSKAMRITAWLSIPLLLLVLAKTGSRGGMMAFGVMLLLLLIISPLKTKIVLIIVSALGLGVVIAAMPDYVRERYLTLFSVDSTANQPDASNPDLSRLQADAGSAEERKRLLIESIDLTLEHPLVGVGPGNFQTAVYDEAKAKGIIHNVWLVTHNSYTQISSETGFPGLILLLCLIGASVKNLSVVLKGARTKGEKPDRAMYAAAKALLLSLVIVCVCVFFLAVGYDFTIYVWCGLTVGLRRVFDQKKVAQSAIAEEPEEIPRETPAFAPDRLADRQTFTVSGKAVRFNRFR